MDKYIKVVLDKNSIEDVLKESATEKPYFCDTIDEFLYAISHEADKIITTQTHAINSIFFEMRLRDNNYS